MPATKTQDKPTMPKTGKWWQQYSDYLESDEWILFRDAIFEARGAFCEKCHSIDRLCLHHLHYRNLGHEKPEDVQILCFKCHNGVHGGEMTGFNMGKWSRKLVRMGEKWLSQEDKMKEQVKRLEWAIANHRPSKKLKSRIKLKRMQSKLKGLKIRLGIEPTPKPEAHTPISVPPTPKQPKAISAAARFAQGDKAWVKQQENNLKYKRPVGPLYLELIG